MSITQSFIEGASQGSAVQMQGFQFPMSCLFLQRIMNFSADSLALRARRQIEKENFTAALKDADAKEMTAGFCDHAEVVEIGYPPDKVLRGLVGQPGGEGLWMVLMIGCAKITN